MQKTSTILLTGVNGFLGHYLTKSLIQKGFIVYGIGRGLCEIQSKNYHYIQADLLNFNNTNIIVQTIKPAIIIHAAANSKADDCEQNPEDAYKINVQSTESLLQSAQTIDAKFIFLSTDFVFDGKKGLYSEEHKTNPINVYGKTKELCEQIVLQYNSHHIIIRTVLVYGKPLPHRQNIVSIIHSKLTQKQTIQLVNDQYRTPTYVHDLVWAIIRLLTTNKNGIWHISGDEPLITPYELGLKLAAIAGLDSQLIIPVNHSTFNEIAQRPKITGLNIQKAKMELNYCPTPFLNAIQAIFQL